MTSKSATNLMIGTFAVGIKWIFYNWPSSFRGMRQSVSFYITFNNLSLVYLPWFIAVRPVTTRSTSEVSIARSVAKDP